MGCSYRAYSVIRLRIDPDRLRTKTKVKAFEHDHPETMNFDPQSGKALWKDEYREIAGYNDAKSLFREWRVVENDSDGNVVVVVAFGPDKANDDVPVRFARIPADFADIIRAFREDMERVGFWNEADFGMWAMLDISC